MHSVLLIAEKKPLQDAFETQMTNPEILRSWQSLKGQTEELAMNNTKILRLAECVWQIPLNDGMSTFLSIAHKICELGFHFRVLFFEDDPKWVYSHAESQKD